MVEHDKVLCVMISAYLSWNLHIDNIFAKISKRPCMLYQLKWPGIGQGEILVVCLIRPVLDMRAKCGTRACQNICLISR